MNVPNNKLYSDDLGESHFEAVTIPLHEAGMIGSLSDEIEAKNRSFVRSIRRMIGTSTTLRNGSILLCWMERLKSKPPPERRQFKAGDILLVEDTTGKGHRTKNILSVARKSIFVSLR